MKKNMLFVIALVSCAFACAENDVLAIDRPISDETEIAFPNDDNIRPQVSEFEVKDHLFTSSESGERWAVVTVENTSAGHRTFKQDQIMALFANGDRQEPLEFREGVEGRKTVSVTLQFRDNKFPILKLITRRR